MNRRHFLQRTALQGMSLAAFGSGFLAGRASPQPVVRPRAKLPELRITRIVAQTARGKRLTPVAPNAYAPYRGYDVREPILRIQTAQGLAGVAHYPGKPEALKDLLGLDPFALFAWDGEIVRGPAAAHRTLLAGLRGADAALFDLLGKALRRPVAALLAKEVRPAVTVYDSSLYMEDLLKPAEREGLVYLQEPLPKDPAHLVARKAQWILRQPEGIEVLKIKIGRAKWMSSFEEALERDIAVVRAIRRAVGPSVVLFVDGNDGYKTRPLAAAEFASAVGDARVYAMEEMFPEDRIGDAREVKRRMRAAGLATKLADGENHVDGIPTKCRAERFAGPNGAEPLFDIEQADMNANGYLRMRAIAAERAAHGMTVAPHNFGSKLGFYTQVHLGLVTPNWEFCETDDSQFPALEPCGFEIRNGRARLTGEPGLGLTLREEALEKPSLVLE